MYRFFVFLFIVPSFCFSYEDWGEGIEIERNASEDVQGPRIAILTVIIGGSEADRIERYRRSSYDEIVSFGTRSKELYAKKHGYDLIVARKKLNDCYGVLATRNLEAAWTKLALISRFLDNYDWVFWTDADSVILNFDVKLESFIDDHYDLVACNEDPNWKEDGRDFSINTGEVFYKNSTIAKFIIKEAWNHHHNLTPLSYEQARMIQCVNNYDLQEHVKVYPSKAFNTSPDVFEVGDFIVHLYSYHGRRLYLKFRELEKKYGFILDQEERS